MTAHRALHLVARPEGLPKDGDFELRSSTLAAPGEGQFLVAVRYVSIDPAMRESFDKQYIRNWLDSIGFDRKPPAPDVPFDIAQKTSAKYREALTRLTSGS